MKFRMLSICSILRLSPSSRGRGLKFIRSFLSFSADVSPSSRGRGLKYIKHFIQHHCAPVALFTRAWIEISQYITYHLPKMSPSSRGRGLKSLLIFSFVSLYTSPSSRGRGLKWHSCRCEWRHASRPLHEGVD